MSASVRRMVVAAVAALVCGFAVQALAQQLDVPAGGVLETSRVGVWMHIQAGPSGTPGGFTVEWMKKSDFDQLGGWPTSYGPGYYYCTFDGVPTANPSTGTFLLGPNGAIDVELGDIFDETGLTANSYDELPTGTELIIRVNAEPGAGLGESAYSANLSATTMSVPAGDCTYTQGFWKTHPGDWPVTSLTLGTVVYNQAQLLSILNTPAAGNGLLILAHQLIAAKLNIANGADPATIAATIAASDALIGGLVIPPVGSGYLSPSSVTSLKDMLDEYNNGTLGVPHCGTVSIVPESWGGLKAAYR